jgi:hydroxyacylglutathione hydrolase
MSPSQHIIPVGIGFSWAYIVRDEGTILVDTGFPGSEGILLSALREHGVLPGDLRLILITHGHADHAGSGAALRQATGALVAAGHHEVGRLRTGISGKLKATSLAGRIFGLFCGRKRLSRYPPLEPDILIDSEYDLLVHGVHGCVIPTPGHTEGSISVLLESGDAIVGDLISAALLFGSPAVPYFADDLYAWSGSIRSVLERSSGRIYTGHGGPFDVETINARLPFKK